MTATPLFQRVLARPPVAFGGGGATRLEAGLAPCSGDPFLCSASELAVLGGSFARRELPSVQGCSRSSRLAQSARRRACRQRACCAVAGLLETLVGPDPCLRVHSARREQPGAEGCWCGSRLASSTSLLCCRRLAWSTRRPSARPCDPCSGLSCGARARGIVTFARTARRRLLIEVFISKVELVMVMLMGEG